MFVYACKCVIKLVTIHLLAVNGLMGIPCRCWCTGRVTKELNLYHMFLIVSMSLCRH